MSTSNSGLIQYNGSSFQQYSTEEGLSHNTVISLCEDKIGRIWVGLLGGGINQLTPIDDTYEINYLNEEKRKWTE